jgi:hypothetical protein
VCRGPAPQGTRKGRGLISPRGRDAVVVAQTAVRRLLPVRRVCGSWNDSSRSVGGNRGTSRQGSQEKPAGDCVGRDDGQTADRRNVGLSCCAVVSIVTGSIGSSRGNQGCCGLGSGPHSWRTSRAAPVCPTSRLHRRQSGPFNSRRAHWVRPHPGPSICSGWRGWQPNHRPR